MEQQPNAPEGVTFADGLRALADLIDQQPEIGKYNMVYLSMVPHDREELVELARELGGRWDKETDGSYFRLNRTFHKGEHSSITLGLALPHHHVCEQVRTGTRTIEVPDPELVAEIPTIKVEEPIWEWKCPDSLLAVTREQVA